jgi:hypothetical protein
MSDRDVNDVVEAVCEIGEKFEVPESVGEGSKVARATRT